MAGCQNKFDKSLWANGDGTSYTYRDGMIDDLMKNFNLKGLPYNQLTKLLGTPDQKDSISITYNIKVKYDIIDPVYDKYLKCYFNKDSIITKAEVKEWKK